MKNLFTFLIVTASATSMSAAIGTQGSTIAPTFAKGNIPAEAFAAENRIAPSAVQRLHAAKAPSDWKFNVSESDIIYETPAGKEMMYSKSGSYYSNSLWGILEGSSPGMPCTVVEGNDGSFYIYNPFSALDTKSWLKGEIEGDKITVKLPQAIYSDSDGTTNYVYVAQMCHFEALDEESGLYVCEEGETELVFNKDGESWVMQTETYNDRPMIMGLVSADDGTWCAYSDWDTTLTPFSGETVTAPEGLATEEWSMLIPIEQNYIAGKFVTIGVSGDEIYMKNLSTMFPDAWVKGNISNGKAIFPSRQYLGADGMANVFGYFFGAKEEQKYNEEWDFWYSETTLTDSVEFDYDAENHNLITDGSLVINKGAGDISIDECFTAPRIKVQKGITDYYPLNPIPGYYSAPGDYMGSVYFYFPNINATGEILDTSNLYYRVYVDDEIFTFYTDEYSGFEEDMDNVPFNFTNLDTIGRYGTCNINHFFQFSFINFDTIDIQTLYIDGKTEYCSDIINVIGRTDSVESIESADVAKIEWYDLAGRLVSNPESGIYIKRSVFSDGHAVSEKVTVK